MPIHCANGTSTVLTCKHKHSCILRASPRPSTPNAVQVVHARGQDRDIARAVHAKTLCKWYKHSTYVQAQALMYTTCITPAVHAKYGTKSSRTRARYVHCPGCPCQNTSGTNTVRTCKHKHSCILRTPPRPPMPYTVQRTHTRTYDEWYNARTAHADRRTHTHTHTR